MGERFTRLKQRISGSTTETDAQIVPVEYGNGSAATHPSEHNSFVSSVIDGDTEARRQHRKEKVRKRGKKTRDKGIGHDPAFLMPIPFYGQIPEAGCVVVGPPSSHDLGCAAVSHIAGPPVYDN